MPSAPCAPRITSSATAAPRRITSRSRQRSTISSACLAAARLFVTDCSSWFRYTMLWPPRSWTVTRSASLPAVSNSLMVS
ncbi:hypothetical protein ASE08_26835 [Rhizobacter sp. Root16D2]|nr:hypothetical protein ASE08_26835 [Rhizobacter sp. Root16D2]